MFNPNDGAATKSAQDMPDQASSGHSNTANFSQAAIQRFMQERVGAALEVEADSLDPTEPVSSYGLDSIASFTLTLELAEFLNRDLPASLFWEFPTIAELAQELGNPE